MPKKLVAVIALIAALSLLVFAGLSLLAPALKKLTGQPATAINQISSALPRFTPTPHPTPYWKSETWEINQKAAALGPGQIYALPLWVNPAWRNARLVGRFQAQGGSGNDIYACVTNQDGFINLKNGHQAKIWYESGRVTVDTINAILPSGHSYFVLSNRFSIFSNKAVTFDLKIEYEQLIYP